MPARLRENLFTRRAVLLLALAFILFPLAYRGLRISCSVFETGPQNQTDFVSQYLIAKAARSGAAPYQNLPVLIDALGEPELRWPGDYPTPHPPTIALLFYPFAFLSFESAERSYYFVQLILFGISVYLILREFGVAKPTWARLLLWIGLFAWFPVYQTLKLGQLNGFLLCLSILSWRNLRAGRPAAAGAFLGGMISIKLFGWPILIYLILRKQWRAAAASFVTVLIINCLAAFLIGWQSFFFYYRSVGKLTWDVMKFVYGNISLPAVFFRLSYYPLLKLMPALPSYGIGAEKMATLIAISVTAVCLLAGLFFAFRSKSIDAAWALLTSLSIVVSPIAWQHGYVLLLPAWFIQFFMLKKLKLPTYYLASVFVAALFLVPVDWLGSRIYNATVQVPGGINWAGFFAQIAIACLFILVYRTNDRLNVTVRSVE